MPLLYSLIALLLSFVPALVAKVLVASGVGIVSYVGMNALLSRVTTVILASAGAIPSEIGVFLNMAGLDVCISMVLSALTIRLALQTTNGVINKVSFTNKALP